MWDSILIFNTYISWYSIIYFIALSAGMLIVYREIIRKKIPKREILPTFFWGLFMGFVGTKVFHLIFYADVELSLEIFKKFFAGGYMYYGGEIFGLAAASIYLIKNKIPYFKFMDIVGIFLLITHGIGRVGCYGSGCCYGTKTNSFLGVVFPGMSSPVHPTQIYESVVLLVAFILIWIFRKKIKVDGLIFSLYLMYYAAARFIIEFYRADAYSMGILNISPSQHIAIIMFLIGSTIMTYVIKNQSKYLISPKVS